MTDTYDTSRAHGRIRARWVSDGFEKDSFEVHNTMSYAAADVLAAAYGGDASRIPKYIGYLYAGDDKVPPPITRDMTWKSVKQIAKDIGGNIQVNRFSRKPSTYVSEIVDSNDQPLYTGNVVEFHAVSRSGVDGEYGADISGMSNFAGPLHSGDTIYRAILLGDGIPCDDENKYTVLAMVDMAKDIGGSKTYRKKPDNYELAIDWRVTFE